MRQAIIYESQCSISHTLSGVKEWKNVNNGNKNRFLIAIASSCVCVGVAGRVERWKVVDVWGGGVEGSGRVDG